METKNKPINILMSLRDEIALFRQQRELSIIVGISSIVGGNNTGLIRKNSKAAQKWGRASVCD